MSEIIYKNFLVTGIGRSGTKFLAYCLNQSKTWTVIHEPKGQIAYNPMKRFSKNYYGEVNPTLLHPDVFIDVLTLPIQNIKLLLRHPYDTIISALEFNASWHSNFNELIRYTVKSINRVYFLNNKGFPIIRYHDLIEYPIYILEVANSFGITDLDKKEIIKMVNPTIRKNQSIESLNLDKKILSFFDQYINYYNLKRI